MIFSDLFYSVEHFLTPEANNAVFKNEGTGL